VADDYQRFLAERRYRQALTHPWIVLSLLGVVVVLGFVRAIFASPFRVTVKSQSLCECLKGERRGRVVASRGRDVEVLAGLSSRAMRSSHEADASRCGPRWVKNDGHHAASAA
jgi:hypothetical protein